MKAVKLSVQDFARPCPRRGHIDHSSVAATTEQGILIHQQAQKKRQEADDAYTAEVKIAHGFERGKWRFEVEGRLDGLYRHEPPVIEEIKSTFDLEGLRERIREDRLDHPYVLQLMTYGFMYRATHGVLPELRFHLVSVRNRRSSDLDWKWQETAYAAWLEARLDELVAEAERAEARAERRKRLAKKIKFPFAQPRPGQKELIATIEAGLANKKSLLLQAPTGLGKTIGVLYPSLLNALARGQSVFYATPKNSQHLVAEEGLEAFAEHGAKLKRLTLTAKSKLCLKGEVFCRPEYCEYARNYHDKVREFALKEVLRGKKKLTPKVFKLLGEKHVVCPYELQWEVAEEADVLIGDYNHAFAPRSALSRVQPLPVDQTGKPMLVVDEAHNLPSRAMEYYSPTLSSQTLSALREGLLTLPRTLADEAIELLDAALAIIRDHLDEKVQRSRVLSPDPALFAEHDSRLRNFLNRYLESDVEIGPRDPVLAFCNYWSGFTEQLEDTILEAREQFFSTYTPDSHGGSLKLTCCDAAEMLKPQYKNFEHTVAFSATLRPFEFYAQLSGLDGDGLVTAEFGSPFDPAQRKLLIIPQISTKLSTRERNYGRVAETIQRISSCRPGNYLAFFPSFAFLHEVYKRFVAPRGFRVLRQERGAPQSQVENTLAVLKLPDLPTILFAVQGGVYSEGIDYRGDMAIGAFIVGPPLPNYDVEREEMKEYYQRRYQQGHNYAYAYPAMAKSVQAAGRVIRTEADRGLIVLMDDRFLAPDYSQSMPRDWFSASPEELVSKSILQDVSRFWENGS